MLFYNLKCTHILKILGVQTRFDPSAIHCGQKKKIKTTTTQTFSKYSIEGWVNNSFQLILFEGWSGNASCEKHTKSFQERGSSDQHPQSQLIDCTPGDLTLDSSLT